MPACAQYDSDESLVIAAPTGSGKTGVLELALARLFGNGTIAGGGRALAVYMAPLKALCHERLLDWQHKLHPLVVVELTGDSADESADERTVAAADLIVTTPEKWDSFTRFRRDAQGVLGRLAVLLVDEVHALVDESRGPTLEAAIARMRTISKTEQLQNMPIARMRVLAASATMSNVEDVAAWLGPGTAIREFGEEFRPVPLRWRVLAYPMGKVRCDAACACASHPVPAHVRAATKRRHAHAQCRAYACLPSARRAYATPMRASPCYPLARAGLLL